MKFRADEIASVIEAEIRDFQGRVEAADVGRVLEVGDGIARVHGLSGAMAGEMVEFANGVRGQVFNLEESSVGVIILGDYLKIAEGDEVRATGKLLSVPVGEALLGRVVDPLGNPLDGKGPILATESRPLETTAPASPVGSRSSNRSKRDQGGRRHDPRRTRSAAIGDWRPQDRQDGRLPRRDHQSKGSGRHLRVCRLRPTASSVAGVIEALRASGAMDYTIVVTAPASAAAPLQYIAPYAGAALAEYFMYKGKHTLVVYDDLSKQAQAYRQLSLLVRRPPGREAYPGDIFFAHSRLLERAAKLSDELGGGSMTALPIIETLQGDVSAYIPTNVISITDGQIYLEPDLFFAGVRPAINVGISVSRVGGNAQTKAMKKVAGGLRLALAQFRELEAFAQLGTELDKATQSQLDRGYRMVELLKQAQYRPLHFADQVVAIYAGTNGYFDSVPVSEVAEAEGFLLTFIREQKSEIREKIMASKELDSATEGLLKAALKEFIVQFNGKKGRK